MYFHVTENVFSLGVASLCDVAAALSVASKVKSGWTCSSDRLPISNSSGCDWHGVTCDQCGKIRSITLNGLRISGSIPSSIGLITDLAVFNLVDNSLHGSIPPSISSLSNMISLGLSSNRLSGTLPSSLVNMTNLSLLLLRNNSLEGTLPPRLCHVPINDLLGYRNSFFTGCFSPYLPPTSSPTTYFESYSNTSLFRSYFHYVRIANSSANVIYFSDFYTKIMVVESSCTSWNVFGNSPPALSSAEYTFESMRATFGTELFPNISSRFYQVNCTSSNIVSNFVAGIRISPPSATRLSSAICNNHVWQAFRCDGAVAICLDCNWTCGCSEASRVINPCASNCSHLAQHFNILEFGIHYAQPPPILTQRVVDVGRTSFQIKVNISSPGYVYCYASTLSVASTIVVKQYGEKMYLNSALTIGTMTLDNLYPSTMYYIYCYTEDLQGRAMSTSLMIEQKTRVATLCCIGIKYISFHDVIRSSNSSTATTSSDVFVFTLDGMPTYEILVSLSLSSCKSSNSSDGKNVSARPSMFAFNPSSTSIFGSFIVLGNSGCFDLHTFVSSGGATSETSNAITIIDRDSAFPTPKLRSAIFSNEGYQLFVYFDYPRVGALSEQFSCDSMLAFTGSHESTCVWTSTQQITITFAANGPWPSVGETVTLSSVETNVECVGTLPCSLATPQIAINAPVVPPSVVAALSTASVVSSCDDITIDPTASSGHCGRSWKQVVWTVSTSWPDNMQIIETLLNTNHSQTYEVINIPKGLLQVGQLTVTLALTNAFGIESAVSKTISILQEKTIPNVRVVGVNEVPIYRWQTLSLLAIASSADCIKDSSQYLTMSWKFYRGSSYLPGVVNAANDPRYFNVDAYTLDTQQTYRAVITVTSSLGSFASEEVIVFVQRSGVTAVISGGRQRIVDIAEGLFIDATSSFDQDYPDHKLDFYWSCFTTAPVYGGNCNLPLHGNATLSFLSNTLGACTYNFTLTVTAVDGSIGLDSTLITVTTREVPLVRISSHSSNYFVSRTRITLNAIISMKNSAFVTWSCEDCNFNLSTLAGSTTSRYLSAGVAQVSLALRKDTLVAGASYTFVLSSSYGTMGMQAFGSSKVSIEIITAPSCGQFVVRPEEGSAMATVFTLNTFGWVDEVSDYPLLYYMTYYVSDPLHPFVIKSKNELPYASTYLGQGLSSVTYKVTVSAQAENIHGAVSTLSSSITVYPCKDLSSLRDKMRDALAVAANSYDSDGTYQTANAVISRLTAANCSLAPDCLALNRHVCSSVAHTCGYCVDGYIGISGFSNVRCSKSPSPTGSKCNSNTDCLTQVCRGGLCSGVSKSCPNNCSGHGVCLFYDWNGLITSSCDSEDAFCRARCRCVTGSYGEDCSKSFEEFNTTQAMREEICMSVYNSVSYQVTDYRINNVRL